MHIPDIVRQGEPINDAGVDDRASVWPIIEAQFAAECPGGVLCVQLVRAYDKIPGVSPCGYANITIPAELSVMHKGDTITVVGGDPCPPPPPPPPPAPDDSSSSASAAAP
jgi:hypothetical protein